MSLLHLLRSLLRWLSPPPTPWVEAGYIYPLDKDYASLEACGLFNGLATAITALTISNDPVRAVVAGFIFGCGAGLLAITMMRIEWDMGPFAGLQDDVP